MKAEKQNESGKYLKITYVEEKKITELKIVDEVTTVDFESKDGSKVTKYQAEVTYQGIEDDSPNIWTMNHASSNTLINAWGDDTDDWMNKPIPIQSAGEGEYKHFKVDPLRIK